MGIAHETAVDGIGQAPFQTSQRFSMAFAGGAFALVIGPAGSVVAELSNGHDMQAMVELAISRAGKPVADDIAGGGLDRGGAGVGGKRRGGTEPIDRADQSKDLADQQSADAVQLGQGGTAGGDGGGDLRGGRGDALIEPTDLADQVTGQRMQGRYSVPGRRAAYVVTWAYVSGSMAWCWRLLEVLFLLCSPSSGVINRVWLAEDPFTSPARPASGFSARTAFSRSQRFSNLLHFKPQISYISSLVLKVGSAGFVDVLRK